MSHSIELGLKWELDSHFHQIILHVWQFIQAQCIMALYDLAIHWSAIQIKISSPRNNFLPPQNWMIHHLASIWIVEIFPVGMQRCQFARKSTDNRSMQLKLIVLETLSFPERFHALRKGPFVAPGSPWLAKESNY
jgi:hypothetical protein